MSRDILKPNRIVFNNFANSLDPDKTLGLILTQTFFETLIVFMKEQSSKKMKNSADDKKAAVKNLILAFDITSITLVSSADKLCEQIGPR